MKIETLAVHAGRENVTDSRAVASPIVLSTTYQREPDGTYPEGYIYSRLGNPNRRELESCLAALEGGSSAAAFASGSAATMAVFQALSAADHVIAPVDVYYGTSGLLKDLFGRWQLGATFVPMDDPEQVRQALQPNTKLIWVETPSNPLLKIAPLRRIAEIAHEAGALCVCDNTWATPVLQRPFELGADLVVHATTKYLAGHSDVLGGAIVTREENDFFSRIRKIQTAGGAVPSPFDCWLTLRGIRTLPLRVRAQSESADKIAKFLSGHPAVERVHYPGLKANPEFELAFAQMSSFGGMLSFQVRGGSVEALHAAAKVKIFTRATSLGGVESFIEHRASIEGPATRTPANLLRVSVGLENSQDLIDDLAQALQP